MGDFLLIIFILFLAAVLFRVDFIYYILYVLIGIYLTSRFVTPRMANKIHLTRSFNPNAFLGETVNVTLRIANKSLIPVPWLQISESIPAALNIGEAASAVISLGSRKSRQMTYDVRAMKRGFYRLGPMRINSGDFFAMREFSGRLPADFLTVYPKVIPLVNLGLPSLLPYGTVPTRQRLFEDLNRPMGVREYNSSDSLRFINWKISAHADELLVRTFEPVISLESIILLNLNREEYSPRNQYDGPEWAIVVAASIAAHLNQRRQAVGLAANGLDPLAVDHAEAALQFEEDSGRLLPTKLNLDESSQNSSQKVLTTMLRSKIHPKSGKTNLMKILERLARIETQDQVEFATWLSHACNFLSWGTNILAVTPRGDERTCSSLHQLLRSGFNPTLIIVEPYTNIRAIRERAGHLGFKAYHAAQERDLDRWRQPQNNGSRGGRR